MSQSLTRRDFLHRLCAGAAAIAASAAMPRLSGAASFPASTPLRPNIIYILADDHSRYFTNEYLGRFGIPEVANLMPNLARLRDSGMRFVNAFGTNSVCAPSRATLLTGKYAHVHGLKGNQSFTFNNYQTTVPQLLHDAGYQTAIFGKWHLGAAIGKKEAEEPQGFDRYKLVSDSKNQLQIYHDTPLVVDSTDLSKYHNWPGYITTNIAKEGLEWVAQRDAQRPFCLFLWHRAPHEAWVPEKKYEHFLDDVTIPDPPTFDDDYATRSSALKNTKMTILNSLYRTKWGGERSLFVSKFGKDPVPEDLSEHEKKKWLYQHMVKDYMRVLRSLDDSIGMVLDYVEANNLSKNTIIWYASDNGFYQGEHALYDKRFGYEEGMHVPLYIRYPGVIPSGSTTDKLVCDVDFAETLLDFAGVPIPPSMQGRSLRPILEGKPPADWRSEVYYHYYENNKAFIIYRHEAVRGDNYKLIHYYIVPREHPSDEWEYFDLTNDPLEQKNLYNDPQYAVQVKQAKEKLAQLREKYAVKEPASLPGDSEGGWNVYAAEAPD